MVRQGIQDSTLEIATGLGPEVEEDTADTSPETDMFPTTDDRPGRAVNVACPLVRLRLIIRTDGITRPTTSDTATAIATAGTGIGSPGAVAGVERLPQEATLTLTSRRIKARGMMVLGATTGGGGMIGRRGDTTGIGAPGSSTRIEPGQAAPGVVVGLP